MRTFLNVSEQVYSFTPSKVDADDSEDRIDHRRDNGKQGTGTHDCYVPSSPEPKPGRTRTGADDDAVAYTGSAFNGDGRTRGGSRSERGEAQSCRLLTFAALCAAGAAACFSAGAYWSQSSSPPHRWPWTTTVKEDSSLAWPGGEQDSAKPALNDYLTSSLCQRLESAEKGSELHSLGRTLEPHCTKLSRSRRHRGANDLSLSSLLPDLTYFKRIADAVNSYPSKISLVAGRGTTGTRKIGITWLPKAGYSTIHCRKVHGCDHNLKARDCMWASHSKMNDDMKVHLVRIRDGIDAHSSNNATWTRTREAVEDDYRALLDIMAKGLKRTLSCGDCGHLVLLDSPFVNMFVELYLALGPTTKVIMLRRDPEGWAASRSEHHGDASLGFLCDKWGSVPDPFNFAQCGALFENSDGNNIDAIVGDDGESKELSTAKNIGKFELPELADAFAKYDSLVHDLVPPEHLLEVNLFTSRTIIDGPKLKLSEDGAYERWSDLQKDTMITFLD